VLGAASLAGELVAAPRTKGDRDVGFSTVVDDQPKLTGLRCPIDENVWAFKWARMDSTTVIRGLRHSFATESLNAITGRPEGQAKALNFPNQRWYILSSVGNEILVCQTARRNVQVLELPLISS
jgi:hypothetical protein